MGPWAAVKAAAEATRTSGVELWFMDEARVGQKGRVGFRRRARGERPRGLRQLGYGWAHLFGAVRPATDDGFALVLPEVSAVAMRAFRPLRRRAGRARGGRPRGSGPRPSRLARLVPPNAALVPLPPYAPGFAPVERVWLFLRERPLSRRLIDGRGAVAAACREAWRALAPERLRSLRA